MKGNAFIDVCPVPVNCCYAIVTMQLMYIFKYTIQQPLKLDYFHDLTLI